MSQLPGAEDPRLFDFWTQLLRDGERGPLPALEHYLARFPGLEAEIEREYRALGARSSPTNPNGSRGKRDGAADSGLRATRRLFERLRDHPPRKHRYDIVGEIGRGGMGVVHQAYDDDLRRSIAMKVARRSSERATASFLDEAQITGQLDHPGIVPVHELGIDEDGAPFFTMKLVKGRTLADVFRLVEAGDREWTATRALNALLRVCEAMAYAHSKGVIHRDLKPTNVMCGEFGEVYVMDWGLARVVGSSIDAAHPDVVSSAESLARVCTTREDELESTPDSPLATRQGDVVGTPHYMSPEQAAGEREKLSARSDVYSAGAILYQLLAGRAPHAGASGEQGRDLVLVRVLAGPPVALSTIRPGLQPELIAICQKAMARDPGERYPDMSAMAADLRAYLEQRVVSAYRVGAWQELKKWCARNRLTASAAGLAILLALGTIIALQELRVNRALADATHRTAGAQAEPGARASIMRSFLEDERAFELLCTELATALEDDRARTGLSPELEARVHKLEQDALTWSAVPMVLRTNARQDQRPDAKTWETRLEAGTEEDAASQWLGVVESLAAARPDAWSSCQALARARLERARRERADATGTPFPSVGSRDDHDRVVAFVDRLAEFCDRDPRFGVTALLQPAAGEPQPADLVPLGADPHSGLLEFAHARTGTVPERLSDGRLTLDEHSALVFVLVPADSAPGAARRFEHEERAAYCIAKDEMTLGQWWRAGNAPSADGMRAWQHLSSEQRRAALMQPVTGIRWTEAVFTLRRLGLHLVSESEWKRAAVSGTRSVERAPAAARPAAGAEPLLLPLDEALRLCVSARAAGSENGLGIRGLESFPAEWTRDVWAIEGGPATSRLRVVRGLDSAGDEDETALQTRSAAALDESSPLLGIRAVHAKSP